MLNNLQQMYLKLFQKKQFKKTTKATSNLIDHEIVDAVAKSQSHKIIGTTRIVPSKTEDV